MGTLLQDLRYSARMLFKHRGFTLVAITTLALGIGANATIFSLINAFLLRPLPVKDPQELVVLLANDRHIPLPHVISIPDFEDYRRESEIFSDLALVFPSPVSFSTAGQSERRWVLVVSGNYFKMLGVEPALGRMFLSEEDVTPGTHPVVVLGYGCWQKQFAGDLGVIGKTVNLNGQPFTVIGVAPEKMSSINWATWDAFVPAMMGESI